MEDLAAVLWMFFCSDDPTRSMLQRAEEVGRLQDSMIVLCTEEKEGDLRLVITESLKVTRLRLVVDQGELYSLRIMTSQTLYNPNQPAAMRNYIEYSAGRGLVVMESCGKPLPGVIAVYFQEK